MRISIFVRKVYHFPWFVLLLAQPSTFFMRIVLCLSGRGEKRLHGHLDLIPFTLAHFTTQYRATFEGAYIKCLVWFGSGLQSCKWPKRAGSCGGWLKVALYSVVKGVQSRHFELF